MMFKNKEELQQFLPKNKKHLASDKIVELLNNPLDDITREEFFKENFISFMDVLADSSTISLNEYINAVKFASYRLLGNTALDCYKKTFPEKTLAYYENGKDKDALVKRADGFLRTKTVQAMLNRGFVQSYILNQPLFQEALNTAAKIMLDEDVSAMARVQAAKTVLEYTKAPEITQLQLEVGVKASDELAELQNTMKTLASMQASNINAGIQSAKEVIEQKIIEVRVEEN